LWERQRQNVTTASNVYITIDEEQNTEYLESLREISQSRRQIRVISNDTPYRLSTAITQPYNPDFDGDELNIFFPASQASGEPLTAQMLNSFHSAGVNNN
jgi:DNA-directed RNA polymerase beta' subunit